MSIGKYQSQYIKEHIKTNFDGIEMVNGVKKVVYMCWFSHSDYTPAFSVRRFNALISLITNIGVPVILITKDNYKIFEHKDYPIHEGFKYLSGNHKSDYMRAYMLYHYGGGYHDIKFREHSWKDEWNKFIDPNIWMIGNRETNKDAIAYAPGEEWVKDEYNKLISMGWVISRPKTAYIEQLYNRIHEILSNKLELLIKSPSNRSRQTDQTDLENKEYYYPLRWLEIMGEISHKLQLNYTDKIDYSLPGILRKTYK